MVQRSTSTSFLISLSRIMSLLVNLCSHEPVKQQWYRFTLRMLFNVFYLFTYFTYYKTALKPDGHHKGFSSSVWKACNSATNNFVYLGECKTSCSLVTPSLFTDSGSSWPPTILILFLGFLISIQYLNGAFKVKSQSWCRWWLTVMVFWTLLFVFLVSPPRRSTEQRASPGTTSTT